jgi:outer membrane protein assembly factor BamB
MSEDPFGGAGREAVVMVRAMLSWVAVLLVGVLLCLPSAAVAASLSMTGYSPPSGSVGTKVVISGTGFRKADIVSFGGTQAAVAGVNAAHTTLTTHVPAFATSGPLTVTDPTTGQTVGLAGSVFQVSRGLFVAPGRAWPGGEVTLAGSGLSPDQTESVVLSRGGQIGEVQTDMNGDFQGSFQVPWNAPSGKGTIGLTDPNDGVISVVLVTDGDWPTFHHDATHSGYQSYETSLTPATVGSLSLKWSYSTGGAVHSSPAVADGMVFVGSDDKKVYALDAVTGALDWSYPTGGAVRSSPTVGDGIVYVGSDDGTVYALDATTGNLDWSYATGGAVRSSPTVTGGVVYVTSTASGVSNEFALDATTGSVIWANQLDTGTPSSITVLGGEFYATQPTPGVIDAFHVSGGITTVDWFDTSRQVFPATPPLVKNLLYIGSYNGLLHAYNASSGAHKWQFDTGDGSEIESSPAVAGGAVYVGSDDTNLYAINATTGSKLWAFFTDVSIDSSPAVAHGVVYVGSENESIYALNASTGAQLWSYTTGRFVESSPAVANGQVYVGSNDGKIYAFGL